MYISVSFLIFFSFSSSSSCRRRTTACLCAAWTTAKKTSWSRTKSRYGAVLQDTSCCSSRVDVCVQSDLKWSNYYKLSHLLIRDLELLTNRFSAGSGLTGLSPPSHRVYFVSQWLSFYFNVTRDWSRNLLLRNANYSDTHQLTARATGPVNQRAELVSLIFRWSCRTSSPCGRWRRGSGCWRGSRWSSSASPSQSSVRETRPTSSTTSRGWVLKTSSKSV